MQEIAQLRRWLDEVPARLQKLSSQAVNSRSGPLKWSPKEELGHLLDSAANNHQRIVRAQLEDQPRMPGYEQERWVQLHGYHQRDWNALISLWKALNLQLLAAASAVPEAAWSRTCTVADSEPLTLKFIFEDYLVHMRHHLEHIGIDVSDLKT
jgi:hypothetical protein